MQFRAPVLVSCSIILIVQAHAQLLPHSDQSRLLNRDGIVFRDDPPYGTPPPPLSAFQNFPQNAPQFAPAYQSAQPSAVQQNQLPTQQFQQATQERVVQEPVYQTSTQSSQKYSPTNQFYPPVETAQNPNLQAIARGNERFALTFFKKVAEVVPNHDFMVSPFSVWALLASAAEGADSRTLDEFKTVLNLQDISYLGPAFEKTLSLLETKTDTVDLTVFQALFHNKSLAIGQEYKDRIYKFYHAEVFPLSGKNSDEQKETVNSIIREQTNGYHKQAFSKGDLEVTSLLLLSLIHFRGQWQFPFNKTYTRSEPFYDEKGEVAGQVEMMFQRSAVPYVPIKELESHVIDLPYGDQKRLRMFVILPRKNVSLLEVLQKLERFTVADIFAQLKRSVEEFQDEEIEIHLPKFNTTSSLTLNAVLQGMGLHNAFSTGADFGKINSNIYLTRITHKSKIMVDEQGTVASSLTAGVFANKSSSPRFYANRPFLYLIVDRVTNLVLFCGQMKNNPVERGNRSKPA